VFQNKLGQITLTCVCPVHQQATLFRALLDRVKVQTSAVIRHGKYHIITLAGKVDTDAANCILIQVTTLVRHLNTMRDGITQQMLQGCGHTVQDAAIQFHLCPAHHQLGLFVQRLAGLAHDTLQTW